MSSFGERLRKLRLEKEIQQLELSKLLNVHKGSISNWENNKRFPDKDMLIKIANFFDVSIDYLLCNTDERNNKHLDLLAGSGGIEKLSDGKATNKILLKQALKIIKNNSNNLATQSDATAAETTLSILNALIDTGELSEENWNEDTIEIIKSAINIYIKNRKKTTDE